MEGPESAMLGMHQVISKMGHLDGNPVTQAKHYPASPGKTLSNYLGKTLSVPRHVISMQALCLPLGVIKSAAKHCAHECTHPL